MKTTDSARLSVLRNQKGFASLLVLAAVTMALTVVIGGATILSMATTNQPISGPLDRLDSNEATPEDMDALQNAGQNMERTVRIAAAGGSLIGSGGPVPNPASPGVLFPGDKAAAGIITRVISRVTNRASAPAQTGDNPLPGGVGGPPRDMGGSEGYNPLTDPNIEGSGSGQNIDNVNRFGSDFQGQQTGGTGRSGQQSSGQQGQNVMQQPGSYTTPGSSGSTTPPDQQDSGYYPPYGYPPDRGGRGPDWERWATDPPHEPAGGHVKPSGGTRPSGGSQPGTSGQCPPGCHVRRDGTGGCDCGSN